MLLAGVDGPVPPGARLETEATFRLDTADREIDDLTRKILHELRAGDGVRLTVTGKAAIKAGTKDGQALKQLTSEPERVVRSGVVADLYDAGLIKSPAISGLYLVRLRNITLRGSQNVHVRVYVVPRS